MSELTYDSPKLTVLGHITDMTRAGKPGLNFDFPGSAVGNRIRRLPALLTYGASRI